MNDFAFEMLKEEYECGLDGFDEDIETDDLYGVCKFCGISPNEYNTSDKVVDCCDACGEKIWDTIHKVEEIVDGACDADASEEEQDAFKEVVITNLFWGREGVTKLC